MVWVNLFVTTTPRCDKHSLNRKGLAALSTSPRAQAGFDLASLWSCTSVLDLGTTVGIDRYVALSPEDGLDVQSGALRTVSEFILNEMHKNWRPISFCIQYAEGFQNRTQQITIPKVTSQLYISFVGSPLAWGRMGSVPMKFLVSTSHHWPRDSALISGWCFGVENARSVQPAGRRMVISSKN